MRVKWIATALLGGALVTGVAQAKPPKAPKAEPAAVAQPSNGTTAEPTPTPDTQPASAGVALRVAPVTGMPQNLSEAVAALGQIIPENDLAELDRDADGAVIAALGLAVRSRWNLWEPSPLVDYFHQKGVQHPDHMSGIILQAWMDVHAGRKIDEAAMFRNFPSWLNGPADDLTAQGDLAGVLAALRAKVTGLAREHFENSAAVVVFSHAFDPAKNGRAIALDSKGRTYQNVLDALCHEAQLNYQVISPSEIRLVDAPAGTRAGR